MIFSYQLLSFHYFQAYTQTASGFTPRVSRLNLLDYRKSSHVHNSASRRVSNANSVASIKAKTFLSDQRSLAPSMIPRPITATGQNTAISKQQQQQLQIQQERDQEQEQEEQYHEHYQQQQYEQKQLQQQQNLLLQSQQQHNVTNAANCKKTMVFVDNDELKSGRTESINDAAAMNEMGDYEFDVEGSGDEGCTGIRVERYILHKSNKE